MIGHDPSERRGLMPQARIDLRIPGAVGVLDSCFSVTRQATSCSRAPARTKMGNAKGPSQRGGPSASGLYDAAPSGRPRDGDYTVRRPLMKLIRNTASAMTSSR